jgi:iron-sulfur cluster assembly protein
MAITMTPAAIKHVAGYIQKRGSGFGIRVAVRTSGCSGMAYVLEFVDQKEPEDQIFEMDGGVRIVIDPKSLAYLDGTELDFVKEGLNEGFAFNNPNVRSECGCGESFNV